MSRVIAVVEGQTEQGFVREVVAPSLSTRGVHLTARLVGKSGHKGGDCKFERARKDILLLLQQERDTVVTTMFDFYALPNSWPGRKKAGDAPHSRKASIVEAAVKKEIVSELGSSFDETRFHPYVQMYEFEALLFCDPAAICSALREPHSHRDIQAIRDSFRTPEEINDDPDNAPSKRLLKKFRGYRKRIHGLIVAQRIGLETMREECPHFAEWVALLESFSAEENTN